LKSPASWPAFGSHSPAFASQQIDSISLIPDVVLRTTLDVLKLEESLQDSPDFEPRPEAWFAHP